MPKPNQNLKCQLTHAEFFTLARWMEQNKSAVNGMPTKQALKLAQQEIPFPITETHIRSSAKVAGVKLGIEQRTYTGNNELKILAAAVEGLYIQLGLDVPEDLLRIAPLQAKLVKHV